MLKEIDLFNIRFDGREYNLQWDIFNMCFKVAYYDALSKDFIIKAVENKELEEEKACRVCGVRIDCGENKCVDCEVN